MSVKAPKLGRLTDTENKQVVTRGEREEGRGNIGRGDFKKG